MINVLIERNKLGEIFHVKVNNHGESIVCASVSALVINTVNSLENFTEENFTCDFDEKDAIIDITLPKVKKGNPCSHDALLLLNSLAFGLNGISVDNKNTISYKEVTI